MPLLLAYIRENLAGAWAVMNGRAQGLQRLDVSIEGFWRSFAAILLVLPTALLFGAGLGASMPAEAPVADSAGGGLTTQVIGNLLEWVGFPILFALVARQIGLAGRYVPYIVARNWSKVVVGVLYVAAGLLGLSGLVSFEVMSIAAVLVFGVELRFSYLLARTALAVSPSMAIPIVAVEVLLSFVIGLGLSRLIGG